MFESLTSEKVMSINHWRYKLLHWVFNIDSNSYKFSKLPSFLYTHYCPFFHFTNLLILIFPIILLIKTIKFIFVNTGYCVFNLFEKLETYKKESSPETWKRWEDTNRLESYFRCYCFSHRTLNSKEDCDENLKMILQKDWLILTKNEITILWNNMYEEAKIAEEIHKKQKEKIIFWVNFSRGFVKFLLNLFYIGLTCFVIYLAYIISEPLFAAICNIVNYWLNLDYSGFLRFIGISSIMLAGTLGVLYIMHLLKFPFIPIMNKTQPACSLMFEIIGAFFGYCTRGVIAIADFVSVFYEEHCPPIKIVEN